MKRWIAVLIAVTLLIAAVNCGPGRANNENEDKKDTQEKTNEKPGESKDKKKDEKDTEAVPVQVVNPYRGDISSFLLFSSNIDAEKIVDIFPMTTGIIEKIVKDEGDRVKKGDVLAILDDREPVINEQRAHINYLQLKAEYERQKEIFEKQMISKEEHERMRYRVETAKLDWQQQKLLLSYTRITSPISGVVTKRHIKQGNKISPAQLSFSVVQVDEKIAVVNIPGHERGYLKLGQKTFISGNNQQVEGRVKRISPAIDPESGTFKVTVEVDDDKGVMAVGQFVNVKIIKDIHNNIILLTKDALVYDGGKVFVFSVNDENKAFKKEIKIGFEEKSVVEVTEGVSPDEKIVTAGKSSLKSDTLVKVIKPVVS